MNCPNSNVVDRFQLVVDTMCKEYCRQHKDPWIIAYSGGKDSTLLLHIAWDILLSLPPEKRRRQIYVISNDTLVESPLVINHLKKSLVVIKKAAKDLNLPVHTKITEPCIDQTFWVNVIGKGYMPPTRNFRWCTDRMKIIPTNKLLEKIVLENERAVLLIGTRKSESNNRRRNMEKRGVQANTMNMHDSINGCKIFSPLADLTDDDVWMILLQRKPPWGGTHRRLITLYRNASGGDCPLVITKNDAPSCGTSSPRFGCWTCTVVRKDKSLRGLIASGHEDQDEMEALADFREWLIYLREDNSNRMDVRRDGRVKTKSDGSRVYGPFKLAVRKEILNKLHKLEKNMNRNLVTASELQVIYDIWRRDSIEDVSRERFMKNIQDGIQI